MHPSLLRAGAVTVGVLVLVVLVLRRRERLLGRAEMLAWIVALVLVLLGVAPGAAELLTRVTGLGGDNRRVVSVLVFAVLGLSAYALSLDSDLAETRAALYRFLGRYAIDRASLNAPPFEVAVVMPAFDEEECLPGVLERAPTNLGGRSVRVLVVDDGSRDRTAEVARAHGALVVRSPYNVGGGYALHVGFAAARELGASWIVSMDADGQHRFEDLPGMLEPLFKGEADIVVGSRRLGQSVGHTSFRSLGLDVFNRAISFLLGRRITDCSSGYRAFRADALGRLTLVQRRHHTAELLLEAARRQLRVFEVPITILPRTHGESKKGHDVLYGLRFARTILASWWRR